MRDVLLGKGCAKPPRAYGRGRGNRGRAPSREEVPDARIGRVFGKPLEDPGRSAMPRPTLQFKPGFSVPKRYGPLQWLVVNHAALEANASPLCSAKLST